MKTGGNEFRPFQRTHAYLIVMFVAFDVVRLSADALVMATPAFLTPLKTTPSILCTLSLPISCDGSC